MGNRSAASSKRSAKPVRRTSPPTGFRLLIFWAQRHPFLSLAGVWLTMMLLGWMAIVGLTYTNSAPLEVAAPQPEAQPQRVEPHKPATSFGLLVMVTATCAAASVLLARQLRPVKPAPRRAIKPLPAPTSRSRSPQQSTPTPPPIPQQIPTLQPPPTPIAQPQSRPRAQASPMFTLIPPDEENPLDWGDASLTSINLRKRNSAIELPRLN